MRLIVLASSGTLYELHDLDDDHRSLVGHVERGDEWRVWRAGEKSPQAGQTRDQAIHAAFPELA